LVGPAHDETAARAGAHALAGYLAGVTGSAALADLAHTLDVGRTHHRHRISVVCSATDLDSGTAALREARAIEVSPVRPTVVFAFPGAGSQYPGMGSRLYAGEPVFTRTVDDCAELLRPHTGHDVRDVITARVGNDRVRDASVGLPALFTVSLATARLLQSWGVHPDVVLGHSLGEYTAAVVSGGLTLPDAARLVAVRCTEVARAAGAGAMLSLDLPADQVTALLTEHPDVDLAAVNGPAGCVVSGPGPAIDALAAAAHAAGTRCRRLHVDAALHSRLVEPAMAAVHAAATGLPSLATEIRMVSTLTGEEVEAELANAEHWTRQLREPVLFSSALLAAVADGPSLVVQVGPGTSLTTLTRALAAAGVLDAITTLDHERLDTETESVRAVPAKLWAHGAGDALAGQRTRPRARVAAPGYAFQPRRLWIDPPTRPTPEPAAMSALTHLPRWRQLPPHSRNTLSTGHFLAVTTTDSAAQLAKILLDNASGTGCHLSTVETFSEDTPLDGVIVLTGAPMGTGNGVVDEVAHVVAAHAGLARRLAGLAVPVPTLLAVTLGADRVESGDRVHPAVAAARALTRVLAQELRGTRWRALDLAPMTDPARAAKAVQAELAELTRAPDSDSGAEVAWRSGLRWQRDLAPWPVTADAEQSSVTEPRWGVVSGGLGDVGLVVSEHLARQGMSVVITSRRAVTDVSLARTALDALTAQGLDIRTRVLDAADAAGWHDLLTELGEQAPVEIVVHAAGAAATTQATPLRDTDPEQIARHLRGKVGGAEALGTAVDRLPASRRPALVLLMSSAATLLGGIGTGPYAAANAALDALATERAGRDEDTHWLSVIWDGWRAGPGGAQRDVALREALDAADGTHALDLLLRLHHTGSAPAVVAVSRTNLDERRTAAAFTQPTASAPDEGGEPITDPVAQRVAALWSELFATPVRSPEADFFALGGHSLLATGMIASLTAEFGVRLRLADLLAAPTVAGLATLLQTRDATPAAPEPATVLEAEPESFDLTRVQHAYWVGRDGGYRWGEVPCHFFLEYDCADLDLARYEQAWNQVITRHPMLRAIVDSHGQVRVLPGLPRYRIRTHDLRELPEDDRQRRLSALRERISLKPGPADRWPLFTVQAALLPGGATRLFLGVDVLICDAASWWIVDRDLHACYTEPGRSLPPVGVHPADCVRALDARRRGPEGERAAAYWRARLPELPAAPAIPIDDNDDGLPPRFVRHSETLDTERWTRLRHAAARHRVTLTAVLLTVYADVLAGWCGRDEFSVMLTLFDRPAVHPDVANVVGDFTSLVLHATDRAGAGSFAERAERTQRRLFSDLDHREFSALDVLAELSTATGQLASVPVVFTSALGLTEVIGAEHDPRWIGRKVSALSQTPQTLLDHQVLEEGGELLLQWDVLEPVVPPRQVAAAIAEHAERVRRLADDPASWTTGGHEPADVVTGVDDADIALLLRDGTRPGRTLYLLHPSGGDVLCYAELSRRLTPDVTVVALSDPGLSTQESAGRVPQSVASLAELYLGVIRRHQTEGPYLLGGWSLGGDLAQRVACLLHEAGEHTELLVLLDSNSPEHITAVTAADPATEIRRRYLDSLRGYLGTDFAPSIMDAPTQREVDAALHEHGLLRRGDTAAGRVEVFARHLHGLAGYRPRRLEDQRTRTLVVKAAQRSPVNSGIGMGVDDVPGDPADLGWTPHLSRPPQTALVRAHHYSLLRGDAVTEIADLVNHELAALDIARHTTERLLP
jgi:acyl transferase domain-containing protein/thioesterase domain-containing protein